MAIIHIKLTKEHLELIANMYAQEDGDDVIFFNKNYLFGGSKLIEDLANILGYGDKYIENTQEDADGKSYPQEIEDHLMEIFNYIKENFYYIVNLMVYYSNKGGLTEGEYKCKDNDLIWEKVENN